MGQGTWGLDIGDDGAADDMRELELEMLERKRAAKDKERKIKNRIKDEVKKQLKKYGIEPKQDRPRGAMVEVSCKCCNQKFMARVADRKRGWGKYCSKSCKAIQQDEYNPKNRIFYKT